MRLEDAHALVIGITGYTRAPQLRTTQDAQDVTAVLQDPACCGYPAGAIRTLVDGDATRAAILDGLDALARNTRESSTVFIYYSGHGVVATAAGIPTYYLVPVDGSIASPAEVAASGISHTELTERIAAIRAGRLTLVLDCCQAAELADLDLGDAIEPISRGRGRVVLAAARTAAYSLPGDRDSTMTRFLVDGLRGAATGVGGVIRICDLFQYVQEHVAAMPLGQRPVFKAELEENYPIAQLRGGTAAPLILPPAPDARPYDAFISYSEADPDDRAWVTGTLVPYLENLGLVLCLEDRDFDPGAPVITEITRAVSDSRFTVAVFSPAYLAAPPEEYQSLLASFLGMESRTPRMIPLIHRPCPLALHVRMTAVLDASREAEVPATLQRLALALRRKPRPRLAAPAEAAAPAAPPPLGSMR
jgi:hypothetical protein